MQLHPGQLRGGCKLSLHLIWSTVAQEDVIVVGPFGDVVAWEDEPLPVLVGEVDGCRQINAERHLFMCRVPEALVDVFQTGSTAAGRAL